MGPNMTGTFIGIPTISTGDGGGGSTTDNDHHSSWYEITSSETVTVAERKQSVVFGELIIDGVQNVDGILLLEA